MPNFYVRNGYLITITGHTIDTVVQVAATPNPPASPTSTIPLTLLLGA